jgi:hypothetical protein
MQPDPECGVDKKGEPLAKPEGPKLPGKSLA